MSNGDNSLNAIVLIYNEKGKPLSDFVLTESQPYLLLDEKLRKKIEENLVDIVVYSHKASFERCLKYETIAPKLEGRAYALREFNLNDDDFSLNRCTEKTESILPEAFKLGQTTPGQENDCEGFHFILESYAPELFDNVPQV